MPTYNPIQMQRTVEFIQRNNPYAYRWTYASIEECILRSMREMVKENMNHLSAMGFTLNYYNDRFEISVDPAMSDGISEYFELT